MMGVEVAGGSAKLCRELAAFQHVELLAQAINIDLYLLAQPRGGRRLSVGTGKHGHLFPLLGIGFELPYQFFDLGIIDLLERFLDGKGHTRVVDVLRGKPKMDKLLVGIEAANGIELFLDEVLHGLYIMVGHLLNVLHAGGIRL